MQIKLLSDDMDISDLFDFVSTLNIQTNNEIQIVDSHQWEDESHVGLRSKYILNDMLEESGYTIFNESYEGNYTFLEHLYQTVKPTNITRCIFSSSSHNMHIISAMLAEKYNSEKIKVIDTGYFYNRMRHMIQDVSHSPIFDKRDKKFVCLNYTPKSHRSLLVNMLHTNDLFDDGLITLQKYTGGMISVDIPNNCQLVSMLPLTFGGTAQNEIFKEAEDTGYFSVVTESLYSMHNEPESVFFTEKTYRCIANNKPFIVVANYNSLTYLKEQGFKTFDKWIDESYDSIRDPYKRLDAIVNEIKRLCSFSHNELIEILKDMNDVLVHNYNNLLKNKYNIRIR